MTDTPRHALDSRGPKQRIVRVLGTALTSSQRPSGEPRLCCIACAQTVTLRSARTEIAGAHEHQFVNPRGDDFHIGCFTHAPGIRSLDPATPRYSWFPGAVWRVGQCGACGLHLGWSYGLPTDFFGLILNRLRDTREGGPEQNTAP
jgi:hypothetical protein